MNENNLKTYKTEEISFETIKEADKAYNYQGKLTPILDQLEGDFNQNTIDQIVLWKVNRYAEVDDSRMKVLNQIDKNSLELDVDLTREVLESLLACTGIQLAMTSTILRFKNPHVYQILDQRVFRFIYGISLQEELRREKDQVKVYLDYLGKLREVCNELFIVFEDSDRVLYELDKKYNKHIKLKY